MFDHGNVSVIFQAYYFIIQLVLFLTHTNANLNDSQIVLQSENRTIYFGAFYPLSGPFSGWGKGCLPAAELAVKYINKRQDILKD